MDLKGPLNMCLEVTSACNLRCRYCSATPFDRGQMTFEELKYVVDVVTGQIEPFEFSLQGGEPFVRSDILQVVEYAAQRHQSLSVLTNGTYITKEMARKLKRLQDLYGFGLQVSIDSHLKHIHNAVRSSFDRTIEGLENLLTEDVMFMTGAVVTSKNIDYMFDYVRFFYAMGVRFMHFMNLMPCPESEKNPQLSVEKGMLNRFWQEFIKFTQGFNGLYCLHPKMRSATDKEQLLSCDGCLAGITRADILCNGDVVACDMADGFVMGNILKQPWEEIWHSEIAERYRRENVPLCYKTVRKLDEPT